MPRALLALQGRVEQLLSLLARALGRCRAEPELLLPLGRVAMQLMPLEGGGEGLALLQLQAAGGGAAGRMRIWAEVWLSWGATAPEARLRCTRPIS